MNKLKKKLKVMTIDINYKEYTLFDIEYYQAKSKTEKDKDCWYSEIDCVVCVKGITHFLKDKLNDPTFNVDEFIKDSEKYKRYVDGFGRHTVTNFVI